MSASNSSAAKPHVQPCEVPTHSLLRKYKDSAGFADCYFIEVTGRVTQAAYIAAFYTSVLFKLERTLLRYLVSKPATDADVKLLAEGQALKFSAWHLEAQTTAELLLADYTGRTRSWLMAEPTDALAAATRLYFGSAVLPRARKPGMGWVFHALLGFHRLYSRMLLRAASRRVRAQSH
jgi:hypothetical protein